MNIGSYLLRPYIHSFSEDAALAKFPAVGGSSDVNMFDTAKKTEVKEPADGEGARG
jgi:hypothetical protein